MSLLITQGLGPTITGPATSLQVSSVSSGAGYVNLNFTATLNPQVVNLDADSFVITNTNGASVQVLSLESPTPGVLKLNTTEQTTGVTYTISLPKVGIVSTDGMPLTNPYSVTFIGTGLPPVTVLTRSVDARTVHIIFSEAVREDDATQVVNYSFTPALTVFSVTKITDRQYELKTSKQDDAASYTLQVSNIRDLANNLI